MTLALESECTVITATVTYRYNFTPNNSPWNDE